MTATANIQNDKNTAANKTNKISEDGEMNNTNNNINMVTRISNFLHQSSNIAEVNQMSSTKMTGKLNRRNSRNNFSNFAAKILGGLAVSALVAAAAISPLSAQPMLADGPAKAIVNSGTSEWNDDFSMAYGIPDTGLGLGAVPASLSVAGYGNMSEENLEIVPAKLTLSPDIEDEGGTGRLFEAYELNVGASPDIEDEGGTGRLFEHWEYPVV